MDSTVQRWVADLKKAHPYLPDALTLDIEKANLKRLARWFEHIQNLRELYDEMDREELPDELQSETGRRQIIPVLMSLDAMTDEETKAWHELFACLSAQMADITYNYWRTHATSTFTLEDALNYTPVVFLYVLSSYNPYPGAKSYDNDFSESDDGRVKLITWVHIEARRHINTYLQQHAYTIKKGSGYMHRLRQHVARLQQEKLTESGELPSQHELVEKLSETHYGSMVTTSTLSSHVTELLSDSDTVSLSDAVGSFDYSAPSLTYEDVLFTSDAEIETTIYDPHGYLEERALSQPKLSVLERQILRRAVVKILHYPEQSLSAMERVYFAD